MHATDDLILTGDGGEGAKLVTITSSPAYVTSLSNHLYAETTVRPYGSVVVLHQYISVCHRPRLYANQIPNRCDIRGQMACASMQKKNAQVCTYIYTQRAVTASRHHHTSIYLKNTLPLFVAPLFVFVCSMGQTAIHRFPGHGALLAKARLASDVILKGSGPAPR